MGNAECLSTDGRDCFWNTVSCSEITIVNATTIPPNSQISPLVCGQMHYSIYGITGYDDPAHWCYNTIQTLEPICLTDGEIDFCSGSGAACTGTRPCPLANS